MKTKKIILLLASMAAVTGSCYSQTLIKGHVKDSTGAPVSFVTVALLRAADSSIVKGTLADDKGEYRFERINSGSYCVRSTFVGFADAYSVPFSIDSSIKEFVVPAINLKSASIKLSEVAVVAIKQTIEFKDGMVVMNVEDNALAAGNNVFELLRRLPGVYIDNQNNIVLNGKAGVMVMIDGRLQRLSGQQLVSILSSMNAENVSKIEVMNNPPVKYDASGSAGMINIVTKKVKIVGFSGNISAGASKGEKYRAGGDGSLNYKGKKFTVFSNLGVARRTFYSRYIFDKKITFNGNTTYLDEDGEQSDYQQSLIGRLGLDWYVNSKTTIGFLVSGGPGANPMTDKGINRVSGYNDVGFDHSDFHVDVTDNWLNPNYNVNLEHVFDTLGSTINYSSDYSNFTGKRRAYSDNVFLDADNNVVLPSNIFISQHITDIKIFTHKLDLRKNFKKDLAFESGLKATFVDNSNDYTLNKQNDVTGNFDTDTTASNVYLYAENIYAAYFNFKKQFQKSSLQVGARGENTIVDARSKTSDFTLRRNYFNFFPTVSFDYNGIKNHSFQYMLRRGINRPGYKDLNPFRSYQDNYSATTGNPYLVPQLNLNNSFTYGYKNTIFQTVSYIWAKNFILNYDFQNDSTKETTSTSANLDGYNYHAWYSIYFQKQLTRWWALNASAYCGYMHYEGTLNNVHFERPFFDYNGSLNNDFIISKSFKVQVNAYYNGPTVYGVMYNESRWSLDVSLRKTLLKDKLTINLSVLDIFYTNIARMHGQFQGMDFIFIKPSDTRRAWLSVNYKFGKIRVQKRQTTGNDEEKNRLDDKTRK